MKLCPSEQNLVRNILKSKCPPHVTSEHRQMTVRFYRPRFIGKNKDHAISWDPEVVST